MRQILVVPLMLVVLLIGACNAASSAPSPLPSPVDSPLPTAIPFSAAVSIVTNQPTTSPTPTPTPWPTNPAVPLFTDSSMITGTVSLVGVIYQTHDGVWRIEATGDSVRLFRHSVDYIFPDGTLAVYFDGSPFLDELWLVDLATSRERNLIENLDLAVCCVVQRPLQSTSILFGSWPLDKVGRNSGFLTATQVEEGKSTVLDEKNTFVGLPAPSPDGKIIAYTDNAYQGVLFYIDGARQLSFDTRAYQVSAEYLLSPAWSPDGKKMAWVTSSNGRNAVGVFDLSRHKAQLSHAYQTNTDWPPTPVWSPDGNWLAYVAVADQESLGGLWVVSIGGSQQEEHHASVPLWSPDSHRLISGDLLFEVGTWHSQPIALPPDAEVIGWVDLSK